RRRAVGGHRRDGVGVVDLQRRLVIGGRGVRELRVGGGRGVRASAGGQKAGQRDRSQREDGELGHLRFSWVAVPCRVGPSTLRHPNWLSPSSSLVLVLVLEGLPARLEQERTSGVTHCVRPASCTCPRRLPLCAARSCAWSRAWCCSTRSATCCCAR